MESVDARERTSSAMRDGQSGGRADAAPQHAGADSAPPMVVELSTPLFRWQCLKDRVCLVVGNEAPDWTNLRTEPAAELVKRNGPREVWRVRVEGQELFAKLHRPVKVGDYVRGLLRGPASRREWRVARYALQAGLAATPPLACGWGRTLKRLGHSVLLTQAVSNAQPLNSFWVQIKDCPDGQEQYRRARDLCERLAEALARAHQSGLRHLDLHAGNLLVRGGPGERPEIVLVDLQSARVSRSLSETEVLQNLVQLNQWFQQHAGRGERLRFLGRYLAWRDELMELPHARRMRMSKRQMLGKLDGMARRHAARLWAKRDRVAMRNGRYFSRIRIPGGWRGHVLLEPRRPTAWLYVRQASFTRSQWRQWLDEPLEWVDASRQQVIKASHSGTVCRCELPLDDGPLAVVCKRSLPRTWLKRFYYLFTRSRNLQTWRRGYALLNRDLPTARPLAVLERRVAGLLLDSIVITQAIEDGHDLDTMLRLYLAPQAQRVQRRVKNRMVGRLAVLVRQMHQSRFTHRDLKASNVLVQWNARRPEHVGLALVDMDGLRLRRRAGKRSELRALARLNVSLDLCTTVTLSDRVRFLKAYVRRPGGRKSDWKVLWRRLAGISGRKRQQKAQRTHWKIEHYGRP